MGWERHVLSNAEGQNFASNNAVINKNAQIKAGSYIENSVIGENVYIGKNCVISCAVIENVSIPDNTAVHILKLADGKFVARIYGVNDDPKKMLYFGKEINAEGELPLWEKHIYKPFEKMNDALKDSLETAKKLIDGEILDDADERLSLRQSFNCADIRDAVLKSEQISYEARVGLFIKALEKRYNLKGEQLENNEEVWDVIGYYIGQALAIYTFIFSPQRIVIGGGVAHQKLLLPIIKKYFVLFNNGYIKNDYIKDLDSYIQLTSLNNRAGLIGSILISNQ
jgi:carbonic anhydrase/acetyltransferase-like protein (isoleucine patch superfamily)